ncbi:MAG: DUF4912 domain-containing protein [Clostridia bacterium]|nr:DUF4912 domain-containing protein [Clostridia bacterium]
MSEVHTHHVYNLPYSYSDNRIVLVAKDPYWLYAYWEMSEERKNIFFEEFGQRLWEKSIPVIKVTNVSNNSSFYIRINDFTNNWYIQVPDPESLYVAELGRQVTDQFFIHLFSSNYVSTPSSSVSSNTGAYFINYKDLRHGRLDINTGEIYESYNYKSQSTLISGISSPELMHFNLQQSAFGISSAELFGINFAEQLGISSLNFLW